MQQGTLEVAQGVNLDYRIYGEEGDFWVILNGYGASYGVWAELLPILSRSHRILMWDYRGTYQSSCPKGEVPQINDHVYDLHALLEHCGIDRPILCGWSVGVQVALEFERAFPDRVRALILHNGAYDHLFHRLLGGFPGTSVVLSGATALMPRVWPLVAPAVRWFGHQNWLTSVCSLLGLVKGKPQGFAQAYNDIMSLDMGDYFAMARAADRHDIASHLKEITVPVLVTAGSRDFVTPPQIARSLCNQIPTAQFELLKGNTHYAILESPVQVATLFEQFVQKAFANA